MNTRYSRFIPFVLGAVVMITLTAILMKYRYEIEIQRQTEQTHLMLDELGAAVSAELNRGQQALTAEAHDAGAGLETTSDSRWSGWRMTRLDGNGLDLQSAVPLIAAQTLRHDLESLSSLKTMVLLGPYASPAGENVVALAMPVADGRGKSGWLGESIRIGDLLPAQLTEDFVKKGSRFELINAATGVALYQSDDGTLDSPQTTTVRYSAVALQLRAAPRSGWHLPLRAWASQLFLLLAVFAWLSYELRRGREIRDVKDHVDEAESRRKQVNILYGKALESVASLEARLQVVSMHDTVTGLANRSSLLRRIEVDFEAMRQTSTGVLGLLAIGFDHQLKHIINSFGTEFASRVLVVAAERIEFVLPSKDLLYRVGDFQLAVVLPNAESSSCVKLAERIAKETEAPISMDGHTFMLRPSVGIAETNSGYQFAEALLDHANTALNAVQRGDEIRYCVFDSATAKASVGRLQLEVDLNRAFDDNQFVLEYEPIVTPVTNAVAGFEALIRWNHPIEGRMPPGKFLDVATQAGMARRLNHWVMREAARQASIWYHAGYRDLFINFNLSAEEFLSDKLEGAMGELLAEFEVPGRCLSVELTESTLIQDLRAAARTLQRLNDLGVRAWLDDFGTGYSSLHYLRQLPLKGVKIDRSFVERTVLDSRDFGFLKSLVDLISYLGMQSIAEGISTQGQYELLSMTTCDLYQGHYFSRSMAPEAAERFMLESRGVESRSRLAG